MEQTASEANAREDFAASLQHMVGDAEQLLQRAGHIGSKGYDSGLKRATEQLRRAKNELLRLEQDTVLHAKHAIRVTDRTVHEHPYAAMGIAAGVGFLLGLLISRR